MKSILTAFLGVFLLLLQLNGNAVTRLWTGGSGANWSVGANWSPAGTPSGSDDIQFTSAALVTLDVNPAVNSISVTASGTVEFSASATRTITLFSTSTTVQGLYIAAGATLKLAPTAAVSMKLSFAGGAGVTGDIYGTLWLAGTVSSASPSLEIGTSSIAFGNIKVYNGGLILCDVNSGNTVGWGTSNFQLEAGSQYRVLRNGGTLPVGNYKNGSLISIRGVISNMFTLNSSAIYDGVIEWNCTSQTITGGTGASFALSSTYIIDSLVVKSTGSSGTLRLATEMTSPPSINTIRVEGGTLEVASPRFANRSMTINNNLTVAGGTFVVNATDGTDGSTVYNMTLTVSGNVSLSGSTSTILLSNRPLGSSSTYGTGNITVTGNLVQTDGLITETAPVPPISDASTITMNGTSPQFLTLTNWTNEVRLSNNNTSGVTLQSNISCPERLLMNTAGAYFVLGNYHFSIPAGYISGNFAAPNPAKFVTNGTGHLSFSGFGTGATILFPVSPSASSVSAVELTNNGAINTFNVRVERGNNPFGIYNTGRTINRTWIINDATNITANTVDLKFIYPDSAANVSCNPAGLMELGHFPVSAWSVDPVSVTRTPLTGVLDTTGLFSPNSLDSAFVLGNQFSILTLQKGITIRYLNGNRGNGQHHLNWGVYCTSNEARFEIQRSGNGRDFAGIGNFTASYTRCLQPFDFTEQQPPAGLNYYRIKATDIDGAITYSETILLQDRNTSTGSITLQPTLVRQPLALLLIDAVSAASASVQITDLNGRAVQINKAQLVKGSNQLTLDLGRLLPGAYYIKVYTESQQWPVVRFVRM